MRFFSLALGLIAAGAVAISAACVGGIGEPPDEKPDETPAPACTGEMPVKPGASPIRRMTRFEYNNTMRDLLGDTTSPAADFSAEEEALGFNNNAAALVTSEALATKYMLAAEGISERATDPITKVLPCDPAVAGQDACALAFIDSFGPRAYRRPLKRAERDAFFALYKTAFSEVDNADPFRTGIELVIQAALQSPYFLYRVEMGTGEGGEGYSALTDWEMASRLSYFLWGTMPDQALFDRAAAGALHTKEDIRDEAERMLDDPKAHDAVRELHAQWLDYGRIGNIAKDAMLFPEYSTAIGAMMKEEMRAFIEHAVFDEGGGLSTMLTSSTSYMPPELAAFYGLSTKGMTPGEASKVSFDPTQRAGILTLGVLMTINAHTNQTSPVHRGKLVREQFLCDILSPPPPDVVFDLPMPDPNSTARERFKQHSEGSCYECHRLMDPLGFGFENFDATGVYRAKEAGKPVDASGSIVESDVNGDFNGAVELANILADSEDVKRCYVKQWFRFGYGRGETKDDLCMIEDLYTELEGADGDVRSLMIALTQTDAFMFKKVEGAK